MMRIAWGEFSVLYTSDLPSQGETELKEAELRTSLSWAPRSRLEVLAEFRRCRPRVGPLWAHDWLVLCCS